jgi:iron complex outermembrane receptor protein
MREPLCGLVAFLIPLCGSAQTAPSDLSQATMEELTQMTVNISSVNRRDQDLWSTAAAAYVITQDEIAHATVSTIPELLRTVPGLQVAQISASTWAVSARGFNSAYANKLLVLIDGRTVYSEIYSGAHWDEVDLPLADVERIEVIRGPGAVVWGTNAVNGVVNIITKSARSVRGHSLLGEVSRINADGTLVQGSSFYNGKVQYRDSLSFVDRRALNNADGSNAVDGEVVYRAQGRVDVRNSDHTQLSLFGGAYGGTLRQQLITRPVASVFSNFETADSIAGGFAMARVEHASTRNSFELQGLFSNATRNELSAHARTLTESVEVVDHLDANPRVGLTGGAELRLTQNSVSSPFKVLFKPNYNNYLLDGYVQGDFVLAPRRVTMTVGAKVQNGSLAGFQVQPSARLAWAIDPHQFLWTAISRGVVAPSLQDTALDVTIALGSEVGLPLTGTLTGDPHFKPETVLAYEAGYRRRISSTLSADVAGFYNFNKSIQSVSAGTPALVLGDRPQISVPLYYANGFSATSQGIEASVEWKPVKRFSMRANYTWLEAQVTNDLGKQGLQVDSFDSPRNDIAILLAWTATRHWQLGGSIQHVGSLPSTSSFNAAGNDGTYDFQSVPAYTRVDVNIERRLGNRLFLSFGGNNLLQGQHREFGGSTTFLEPLFVPRSVFARARWSF